MSGPPPVSIGINPNVGCGLSLLNQGKDQAKDEDRNGTQHSANRCVQGENVTSSTFLLVQS